MLTYLCATVVFQFKEEAIQKMFSYQQMLHTTINTSYNWLLNWM